MFGLFSSLLLRAANVKQTRHANYSVKLLYPYLFSVKLKFTQKKIDLAELNVERVTLEVFDNDLGEGSLCS